MMDLTLGGTICLPSWGLSPASTIGSTCIDAPDSAPVLPSLAPRQLLAGWADRKLPVKMSERANDARFQLTE